MESNYLFLLELAIVLASAHIAGAISVRLKQPAVLGQIVVGLILGAGLMAKTDLITSFSHIGVVLLMFIAGLETDVKELLASIKSSSLIALGGVVFPALMVVISVKLIFPNHNIISAVFLGVVSTATSVSISVQTLREIGKLRTKQGLMILGAAIIDDVIGIILLTLLVGVVNPTVSSSIGLVLLKVFGLFGLLYLVGIITLKFLKRFDYIVDLDEKVISWSIIICFVLAFVSEGFGVAAITGAYFTGIIFSMTSYQHRVSHEMSKIAGMLFTPVFFVSIGMDINLFSAFNAVGVGSLLIIFGSIGKVVGCGLGSKISGFSSAEALQIGVGMIPRAEVAIIVANLGLQMNILSDKDMAAAILMVLVTTLVTPSLLKWTFNRNEAVVNE